MASSNAHCFEYDHTIPDDNPFLNKDYTVNGKFKWISNETVEE